MSPRLFPPVAPLALAGALLAGPAAAADPTAADPTAAEAGSTAAEADRAPRSEWKNLAVADGLSVDLFAAEPMLLSPSNIDVDARGRVWVCEVVNYRHFRNADNPPREAGDRILVLEDTDGDGSLDAQHVFYQSPEIDSAHGVCVLGETVIVSAGENVLKFTDADGDLVADPGSREVLFTGIGGVQHDHGIHSALFGPDGKLYLTFGNVGGQLKHADGSPVVDVAGNVVDSSRTPYQEGMAFRCDLDGSNVETLGWNFRNNWELAVDSFGRVWQSDNDDDGNRATRLNFVLPGGNYGFKDELTGANWRLDRVGMADEVPLRHWHLNDPGVMPNLLQTGAGSPTGIAVYEGDLLPGLRGALLHCDAGPNAVRAYTLESDGAGFVAEKIDLLTGEADRWFRPSDVTVAPDGSLIVADWYDPGVGGHRMEDVSRGRLFRVRPATSPLRYAAPALDLSTAAGALAALNGANLDARYQGYAALQSMGSAAADVLRAQFEDESAPAHLRARALWALTDLEPPQPAVDRALTDDDPRIRATALRVLRQRADLRRDGAAERRVTVLSALLYGRGESDPAVLREAAVTLRGVPADAGADGVTAADLWALIAWGLVPGDRWMLESLGVAADGQWDAYLAAYLAPSYGRLGPDGEPMLGKRFHEDPQARDVVWRSRAAMTPTLLSDLILNQQRVSADEVPRLLRAFDFQPDSAGKRAALQRLAFAKRLPEDRAALVRLETLTRLEGAGDDPRVKDALDQVLDDARGTERFVTLTRRFGLRGRVGDLLDLMAEKPDESAGVAAATLLVERNKWDDLKAAAWAEDRAAAEAVVAALGRTGNRRVVEFLAAVMKDEDLDAARRKAAVAGLARVREGAETLLDEAEADALPAELRQAAAAALTSAPHADLADRVAALFPPPPGRENPLPPLAELTAARGDVAAGKLVYMTTGTCSKCHVIKGVGRDVGPDLTEIGDKLGRQALYTSILYPSAGVSHDYETHTVLTDEGGVFNGLLIAETDETLRIKDQEGLERSFDKANLLEHIVQDVSLMPADIQKLMSERELIDLVEFLTTLKKTD